MPVLVKRLTQSLDPLGNLPSTVITRVEQRLTIPMALDAPHLCDLEMDPGMKVKVISSLIMQAQEYFTVSLKMNADQCAQTAILLLEKYPHESMEDIILMLKMAKMSTEKLFRIDGTVVFKWMEDYLIRKADVRTQHLEMVKKNGIERIAIEAGLISEKARELREVTEEAVKKFRKWRRAILDTGFNDDEYEKFKKAYEATTSLDKQVNGTIKAESDKSSEGMEIPESSSRA